MPFWAALSSARTASRTTSAASSTLLATAVVPSAQLIYQREREAELRDALRTIRTAVDAYKRATDEGHIKKDVDKSGYLPDLQVLEIGRAHV